MSRFMYPYDLHGGGATGLLLLRLIAGTGLMLHGLQKLGNPAGWMGPDAPVPGVLQLMAALAEFGGGLLWVLGLLTPLAALAVIINMLAAAFLVHIPAGDPFVRLPGPAEGVSLYGLPDQLVLVGGVGGSLEPAMLYLGAAVALLLLGAGAISLDARIFGRRLRPTLHGQAMQPAR